MNMVNIITKKKLGQELTAEEIRYFASTVADRSIENHTNTPESARKSVALVEKLRESAAQNGTWIKP